MRFEIKRLQKEYNFTIIFVTHDQSEALALSDRILVMDKGNIIQIDTPENLYNKPINLFVHNFLGESNFINVEHKNNQIYAIGDDQQALPNRIKHKEKVKILATRPSEIEINNESGFKTRVLRRVILSDYIEYFVVMGLQQLKVQAPHHVMFEEGDECYVSFINPVYYDEEGFTVE